jgi:hypothetical protein
MTERSGADELDRAAASAFTALECRVGLGRMSIATDMIDVLGEYAVGVRLPLTERIAYSVGVWDGEVVLSLSLARVDRVAACTTSGLLLTVPGSATRWAFEIVAPVGIIDVVSISKPQSAATRWLRTASLARGSAIQFVDLRSLIEDLETVARRIAP